MKRLVVLIRCGAALAALLAPLAFAQTGPAGHWEATIKSCRPPGCQEFESVLVLDLAKNAKQEWQASMDMPAENMTGLKVNDLSVNGDSVRFVALEFGSMKFDLTLGADGALKGTMTLRIGQVEGPVPVSFKRTGEAKAQTIAPSPAVSKDLEGDWQGSANLPLLFHFRNQPDGTVSATMDNAPSAGFPLDNVKQTGERVEFRIRVAQASFQGTLNKEGTEIAGQLNMNGQNRPLTLRKGSPQLSPAGPQGSGPAQSPAVAPGSGAPGTARRSLTEQASPSTPSVSQDGKLLAYAAAGQGGQLDIWLKPLGGGTARRLAAQGRQPCLAPDGSSVVFHSDLDGGLHAVGISDGRDRLLSNNAWNPRFSPNGKQIAYWTGNPTAGAVDAGDQKIHVLDLVTGADAVIWTGGAVTGASARVNISLNPVWSPDGSRLIFTAAGLPFVVPAAGRTAVRLNGLASDPIGGEWRIASVGDWDKDGLLIEARSQARSASSIWHLPVNPQTASIAGPAQQLTPGTANEAEPRSLGDGHMVYSSTLSATSLYYAPIEADTGQVTGQPALLRKSAGPDTGPSISRDGRMLVFRAGSSLTLMNLKTNEERAISNSGVYAAISGDGSMIGFSQRGTGPIGLSILNLAENWQPVSIGLGGQMAYCWSRDNSRLLYMAMQAPQSSQGANVQALMNELNEASSNPGSRSPAEMNALMQRLRDATTNPAGPKYVVASYNRVTGKSSIVLEHPTLSVFQAFLSPDENWIAFLIQDPSNPASIYVARTDGESRIDPQSWIPVHVGKTYANKPRWSPDGNLLYFVSDRDGSRCVWAQRLDAATKRPLGDAIEVLHLPDAQLSMRSVNDAQLEIAVAVDKLVLPLAATSSGIWFQ